MEAGVRDDVAITLVITHTSKADDMDTALLRVNLRASQNSAGSEPATTLHTGTRAYCS